MDRTKPRIGRTGFDAVWAILLAAGYVTFVQWRAYGDGYFVNGDAAQHLIWLHDVSWADPFYAEAAHLIQPWGYAGLCELLSWFMSPTTITLFGPYLVGILTVFLSLRILRPYWPFALALAASTLAMHLAFDQTSGFFSRAWAVPALQLFTLYWLRRDYRGVAAAWIFGALFYPPSLLLSVVLAGLETIYTWMVGKTIWVDLRAKQVLFGHRLMLSGWLTLLLGGGLALGLLLAKNYQIRSAPELGRFLPREVLTEQSEFRTAGRVNFRIAAEKSPFLYFVNRLERMELPTSPYALFTLGSLLLTVLWLGKDRAVHRFDVHLILTLLAAFILYYAAQWLLPRLFLPDRFLNRPGRWLLSVLLVRLCFVFPLPWRSPWLILPALLAAGFYLTRFPNLRNGGIRNFEYYAPAYDAVAGLPDTVLIAAPPATADQIPFFAARSVLISEESAHALYFEHYYDYVTPRWRDFIAAWAARPGEEDRLVHLVRAYGVTHFLIDRERLAEKQLERTFMPHARTWVDATSDVPANELLLNQVPGERGLGGEGRFLLLEAEVLLAWLAMKASSRKTDLR